MELLVPMFTVLLTQLPNILVLLIGFVLSLVYWQRHPRVSLLTTIATAGFLINLLVSSSLSVLPLLWLEQGWETSQMGIIMTTIGIITSLLSAVYWGLLFTAIFGWRKTLTEGEIIT